MTTTVLEQNVKTPEAFMTATPDLSNDTVVLQLTIRGVTFRRKLRSEDVVTDGTDTNYIHVSKDIIERREIRELNRLTNRLRQWLEWRAVPCSMLREGMYLLPLGLVEDVDKELQAFQTNRMTVLDKFLERYDDLKTTAASRLGTHYSAEDYPDPETIRRAFTVQARYLSFNVPAALESLNKELYEREKARVAMEWQEASVEVQQALREALSGLIDHFVNRLGTDSDGKPKIFKASTVKQLSDFLESFGARNLTNDVELQQLVEQAKQLMSGLDPEALRKSKMIRSTTREGFERIQAKLDTLVVNKTRQFVLNDSEEV